MCRKSAMRGVEQEIDPDRGGSYAPFVRSGQNSLLEHNESRVDPTLQTNPCVVFIRSAILGACLLLGLFVWSSAFAEAEPLKVNVTVEKLFNFQKPLTRHLTCFSNTNHLFVYHLFQKPNLVYHWSIKDKK